MNLRQLETFLHVAKAGSISRAAAQMRVAQPVVSRMLKTLEADLGVRLFDRASRGVRLTEPGRQLSGRGAELLQNFADLQRDLRAQAAEPAGRLSVGMPPSLSRLLTARVIPAYLERFPRVLLSIHEANSSALCASLLTGDVDMAVVSSIDPPLEVWMESFVSEPFVLIGPADAPYAGRAEIALSELLDLPLILVSRPNALRKLLDRKFSEAGGVAHVVAEANSLIAVAMVQAGLGHTILPSSAAWGVRQTGEVCCIPVRGLRTTWTVACQNSNPLSDAGARFIEVLRSETVKAIASGEWEAVAV